MAESGTRDRLEVTVALSVDDVIAALQRMTAEDREDFIESLLAATSRDYLKSIDEARSDWKAGRVKDHSQVFGDAD